MISNREDCTIQSQHGSAEIRRPTPNKRSRLVRGLGCPTLVPVAAFVGCRSKEGTLGELQIRRDPSLAMKKNRRERQDTFGSGWQGGAQGRGDQRGEGAERRRGGPASAAILARRRQRQGGRWLAGALARRLLCAP